MYAVIATGGKQYKVKEGQSFRAEKLEVAEGDVLNLEVLLVADEDGSNVKVGAPTLSDAKVTAKVVEQGRAAKIRIVKYKPKSRYTRVNGHRQPYTLLQVEKITA